MIHRCEIQILQNQRFLMLFVSSFVGVSSGDALLDSRLTVGFARSPGSMYLSPEISFLNDFFSRNPSMAALWDGLASRHIGDSVESCHQQKQVPLFRSLFRQAVSDSTCSCPSCPHFWRLGKITKYPKWSGRLYKQR